MNLIKNVNVLCEIDRELTIYGAGDAGKIVAEFLDICGKHDYHFCDRDRLKQKDGEHKVILTENAVNEDTDFVVAFLENDTGKISSVLNFLRNNGIAGSNIYAVDIDAVISEGHALFLDRFKEKLLSRKKTLESVYQVKNISFVAGGYTAKVDEKWCGGGGASTVSIIKKILGYKYNGIQLKYPFYKHETRWNGEGIHRFFYMTDWIENAMEIVAGETETLYIVFDIFSAYGLFIEGKNYIYIDCNAGNTYMDLVGSGYYISDAEKYQFLNIERAAVANALQVRFKSSGGLFFFKKNHNNLLYKTGDYLYNTVYDHPEHETISGLKKDFNKITFISIGNLNYTKGVDRIPELLFKYIKYKKGKIRWIVIGSGFFTQNIDKQMDELKRKYDIEYIRINTPITHAQIFYALSVSDIYVMLQRKSIFDYSTLEAMSEGKAVILSDIPGNTDFNVDDNILLYSDDTEVETLTSYIDKRDEYGEKNRKVFETYFGNDSFIERYKNLINEFVGSFECKDELSCGGIITNKVSDFKYVVVGAGLAGLTMAERIANVMGQEVLVIEKRQNIGGNVYDSFNDDGILIHNYGPHTFHTNDKEVFDYVRQFTEWNYYQHRVLSYVDGNYIPFPICLETINDLYNVNLSEEEIERFLDSHKESIDEIKTSEDVVLSQVGRELYEKFFKDFTLKQWGVLPNELDKSVISRIPFRKNRDTRYFTDKYQGNPKHGYTKMCENMIKSPKIHILLNTDYKNIIDSIDYKKMIYTGPIDYFFNSIYGELRYRSIRFEFETYDMESYQPTASTRYPSDYDFTRITEFKKLTGQKSNKTTICREYPCFGEEPYYPFPTSSEEERAEKYRKLAKKEKGVYFVGRLAEYKYLNMDSVIRKALNLFNYTIKNDV